MASVHQRRGFTAIELAVVMGVILLMVGLTLPAISRSMRKGRLAESVNTFQSMHQQAMSAAQQYQMTYGIAGVVKLEIVNDTSDKKTFINLKIGASTTSYTLPTTVEAAGGPVLYSPGTGLPTVPATSLSFQTLDGKDQTRIYIAASGLTKVESQ